MVVEVRDGGQGAELLDCTDSVTNHHVPVLSAVVNRCDESYLCLDVSKTKDLSIDFRSKSVQRSPLPFAMKLLNLLTVLSIFGW